MFYICLFKILFLSCAFEVGGHETGNRWLLLPYSGRLLKISLSFILSNNICEFFLSEVTCRDEDSIQYFEGATWSVGSCIQCSCTQGKIRCKRELLLVSFLQLGGQKPAVILNEPNFSENCDQFECNVANFMKKNNGVCKG